MVFYNHFEHILEWLMRDVTGRELAIFKRQYSRLRQRHKKFSGSVLSLCEFIEISKQPCTYCGVPFSKVIPDASTKNVRRFHSTSTIHINGIDRLTSSTGYTFRNSTSSCMTCNNAKHTMNKVEFIKWVKLAYKHLHG